MAYPKSLYRMTAEGMKEKHAMSQKEHSDMAREGWQDHPEEARLMYRPETPKKPGRPRKQ